MRSKALVVTALALLLSLSVIGAEQRRNMFSNTQVQPTSAVQDADPLSGEWTATFHMRDTTVPATFKFRLEGTNVTGTLYSDHTGESSIRDGKWSDGKLSFTADVKDHPPLVAQAILKDGKLAGEVHHLNGPTFKWEAIKK